MTREMDAKTARRLPPPLNLSLDDVPLDRMVMPSLKQIINREVTPEEQARAEVLEALQRVKQWRGASLKQRGDTIAGLLDLVSAMGRYPPQRTEFPGFPGSPKRQQ